LRELRNVIERSTILADKKEIDITDLPENLHRPTSSGVSVGSKASLEELEAEHIKRIIMSTPSLGEAAQILGIDPATLYRKRKRMGMHPGPRRQGEGAEAQAPLEEQREQPAQSSDNEDHDDAPANVT
jgi:DNA-binding NtrC family response regulator